MSPSRLHLRSEEISRLDDTVFVKDIDYSAIIRSKPCNFVITAELKTDFLKASLTDDLKYSINYAVLSREFKSFEEKTKSNSFKSFQDLGYQLFHQIIFKEKSCDRASLTFKQIHDNYSILVQLNKARRSDVDESLESEVVSQVDKNDQIAVQGLKLMTIIGVFKEERFKKQPVILDINMEVDFSKCKDLDTNQLAGVISKYIENSNFKTVEALVLNVSKLVFSFSQDIISCKVGVTKPDAIDFTNGVGVAVKRTRSEITDLHDVVEFDGDDITIDSYVIPNLNVETNVITGEEYHTAYLAFGSNIGNQLQNINDAINILNDKGISVLATSSLYKSKPMYHLDQPDFFNGCLKVKTNLSPLDLLKELKDIEYNLLNRVKKFDNGPRSIDLDILLYDNLIVNEPTLNIPHISMLERSFVLLPLCELIEPTYIHPVTAEPVHNHLSQLLKGFFKVDKSIQESIDLETVIPLPSKCSSSRFEHMSYDLLNNKTRTQLMSILNITPDSFSDGSSENLESAKIMEKVDSMIQNGVDIIDVGGCSTRPNSPQPTEQEELSRVLPVVRAIKEKYPDVLISIDTYRATVAEESIKLGADIINDISAGMFDDRMYDVIAKYGVPYVINHTRGLISTMNKLTDYSSTKTQDLIIFNEPETEQDIIVNELSKELASLMTTMYKKGIKRWQLILDPGLGFAKNLKQNIAVISHLPTFKNYKQLNVETGDFISFEYMPVLLGPSRKNFIGTITGKKCASERVIGTSATIMSCIGFGSDIVRVHDYVEIKDVCKMGDAIYKGI
ncbi:hypothetical protein CANARDRAFT_28405 [[Candida] arabinofermentans NRRL YB-2248]|uniref:Pterin-binding domain-containing protein n=1 Tax=[Candida] arabinofermentans NRRL YB-2248 TaxID=983967 RepID=A0A1E4T1L9_9ASCO|nr:hypothetical protein CANARDRAFT_28405 [[Candida] arabinofermentans NRRL YB-2248]